MGKKIDPFAPLMTLAQDQQAYCRGNASHTARGGVDNQVDDSARRARSVAVTSATPPVAEWTTTTPPPPTAHHRTTAAGPRHPLCLRNGGGGDLRLTFRTSTSTPLARLLHRDCART